MKVTLSLTHKCNLACSYCYAGRATKPDMSFSTAKKCVDFALEATPDGKSLGLCLFGGEPLLRFDLVREITAYSYQKAAEANKTVRISITTNGTLVDPEVIDFAADQDIHLCFSIDGPPDLHDRKRAYRDGRGSFDDVMRRLELAVKRLDTVQVNAVFCPDTLMDLPRCLEFFVDLGIPVIHLNPDITASWPDNLLPGLHEVYTRIAEYYIDCYTQGNEIAINLLDGKMLLFIKGGYAGADMCAMGDGEWGFAPSGNIYPCERFIGEDENSPYCLGNIHTGLDLERRCALRLERGNHNPGCIDCGLNKYCMNWCGCTNYFMSGRADIPAPPLCAMERAAIRAARHVFDSLVQAENELFADHLYKYTNAGIHHRRRDVINS
jgi:uncharacterized protein